MFSQPTWITVAAWQRPSPRVDLHSRRSRRRPCGELPVLSGRQAGGHNVTSRVSVGWFVYSANGTPFAVTRIHAICPVCVMTHHADFFGTTSVTFTETWPVV